MENRVGRMTTRGQWPAMVVEQFGEEADTTNLCVFTSQGVHVEHGVPLAELGFYTPGAKPAPVAETPAPADAPRALTAAEKKAQKKAAAEAEAVKDE